MQFVAFKLENFRGISKPLTIDMTNGNLSFPFVLIGDNESGKTTILEGIKTIYRLCSGEELDDSFIASMRPKSPSFSNKITLTAYLSFNENEKKVLSIKQNSSKKDNLNNDTPLEISFSYDFIKNKLVNHSILINGTKVKDSNNPQIQEKETLQKIKEFIPEIIYYDDFAYDVPDKIRFLKSAFSTDDLSSYDRELLESEQNHQWQKILNDIFVGSCTSDEDMNFQDDIIDYDENDQITIEQRFNAINKHLNQVIGKNWSDVTGNERRIDSFSLRRDSIDGKLVDFQLQITSNEKTFFLHERSKGFRWFFCFKLLTEIRAKSDRNKNGIIFLLDEPASNLHITVQKKILNSLNSLSNSKNQVIYSTHSPYLINKKTCENLFSVYNEVSDNTSEANDDHLFEISCEKLSSLEEITVSNKRPIEVALQADWISFLNEDASEENNIEENNSEEDDVESGDFKEDDVESGDFKEDDVEENYSKKSRREFLSLWKKAKDSVHIKIDPKIISTAMKILYYSIGK
ncbi:AAA family ATPase [Bartonella sp. CB60]|uniref:AAA family ATPase n=1 Tax=Bartonella sp. CB60 TaxID=3113619 RepID=UPI00300DFA64